MVRHKARQYGKAYNERDVIFPENTGHKAAKLGFFMAPNHSPHKKASPISEGCCRLKAFLYA
jgi:hypothetical protein